MSEKKSGYGGLAILSLLLTALGVAAALIGFLTTWIPRGIARPIVSYAGIVLAVIGFIALLACLVKQRKFNKEQARQEAEQEQQQAALQSQADFGNGGEVQQPVRYVPSENVYQFVNMGERQSIEEKFNEIAKMDKTQFVIYVARLFSRKGYQVKFTPVINNHNVDLLVEKLDVTIAVGCILSQKVLTEGDIRCVVDGSRYYHANNVMALTNTYFDRTAVDYAKRERMSLVDRNILAEDFMSR